MGPRVRQSPWGSNRTKAAPLRRDWAPHPRAEPPTHSCGSSGSGSSCTCRTRHRSRSHLGRESGRQPRDGTGRDGHSRDGALTGGTRAVLGVHGLAWLGSVGFGSARLAAVRTRSDRALFMRWRRGAVLGAAHGGAGPRSLGAVLSAGPCSAWGRAHPGAVLTPGRCRGAVLTRGRAVLNPGHGTVVPVVVPPPPGSQPAVGRPGDPTRTQFCPSAPPRQGVAPWGAEMLEDAWGERVTALAWHCHQLLHIWDSPATLPGPSQPCVPTAGVQLCRPCLRRPWGVRGCPQGWDSLSILPESGVTLGQTLWGWGARLAPQEGRTLGRSIGMQGGSVARPAGIWWESWLRGTGATHCVSPLSQRLRAKPASTVPTASSAHGTENCCWARDRLSSRLCPLLSVVLVLRTGQAWAHAEGGSRPRGAQASGPWDREGVSCPGRSCQGTACACLQKHRGGFFFFFLGSVLQAAARQCKYEAEPAGIALAAG